MKESHLYLHPQGFTCYGSWQQVASWLALLCRKYETIGALRASLQKDPPSKLSLPPFFQ